MKACPAPGCDKLVSKGYCPDHTSYGYQRGPGAGTRQAIYNSRRWKALARQVKREQPWCNVPGCHTLTQQVDHIIPLRVMLEQGLDPYARQAVQGLCLKHHGEKTRQEQYGFKA